jgi:hypothetical protein
MRRAVKNNKEALAFSAMNRGDDSSGETLVCSTCGCAPCEWQQYVLSVLNLMAHAFNHSNLLSDGRLICLFAKSVVKSDIVRRIAYKGFQYENMDQSVLENHFPFYNA